MARQGGAEAQVQRPMYCCRWLQALEDLGPAFRKESPAKGTEASAFPDAPVPRPGDDFPCRGSGAQDLRRW